MGRPIGKHLGYFYDTFEVTFWINFVHLAQPIKIFYKTKGIYVLIFKIKLLAYLISKFIDSTVLSST